MYTKPHNFMPSTIYSTLAKIAPYLPNSPVAQVANFAILEKLAQLFNISQNTCQTHTC
jgi:hypothetical protein